MEELSYDLTSTHKLLMYNGRSVEQAYRCLVRAIPPEIPQGTVV